MSITASILSILSSSYTFVYEWGYIGIFILTLIESGSIFFFPLPSFPLIFTFGGVLNPFLIGVSAALGSTIGLTTSYVLGLGGKELMEKKHSEKLKKIRQAFEMYGAFWWLIVIMIFPFLPDSIAGIFCGMVKYDIKKYFLAILIAKLIANLILAYSGYYSVEWFLHFFRISLPPI